MGSHNLVFWRDVALFDIDDISIRKRERCALLQSLPRKDRQASKTVRDPHLRLPREKPLETSAQSAGTTNRTDTLMDLIH